MKRWLVSGAALFAGTIIAGIATGCAPDTSAPTLVPRLSLPAQEENRTVAFSVVQPTPVREPFTDTACLDCHTDQAQLTTLAVAEEKTESLSSGPG